MFRAFLPEKQLEVWMQKFVAADGVKIAYRDEGEGLPVLALSGLTRNSNDFNFVAPHLKGVRLIRMDYRGRGHSDRAPHSTYTIPQEAQDALTLMDHLGLERAAILGTSRGGLIAMGLAATVKDRLIGVCLNDIGPDLDPLGLTYIMSYLGRRPSWRAFGSIVAMRKAAMEQAGFHNVPDARWEEEVSYLYEDLNGKWENRYDPALRTAVEEAGAQPMPDLWPFYDAFKGLPLALIHGANSDLLTDTTVSKMQSRNPDLRYAKVADRGHVPFLDEPEALAVIHSWLDICHEY
ncbi:alpha/beta hydrolase [Aliiroseovarius sp. KMU-50]|uniref:Alpha/beta hydrolase n=1 Tax=Aliiroseovarius salicola TaxID=3009082 RepID=A0ABT4W4R5_9RHOB|nr:alpha/beta hydrolase [Aliiroseovarius sp. KMU-50]MDA5095501.1 alpha/beta hydrolase [Aliiroseovarius sp. KMU-50]